MQASSSSLSSGSSHSAIGLFRLSATIEAAVATFTKKKISELGDNEFRIFAQAIVGIPPIRGDLTKLINLHGRVHITAPAIADKIYELCMGQSDTLSAPSTSIDELYKKLTAQLTIQQIVQNQFRTLQYLDLASDLKKGKSPLEVPLVQACLEVGNDSEIQHDTLLDRIRVIRESAEQAKENPKKINQFISKIISMLATIPIETRSAAIKIGTKNYTKPLDSYFVTAISLLPPESRNDPHVIAAISSILNMAGMDIPPKSPVAISYEKTSILTHLQKIPLEERAEIILKSIPFMIGLSKHHDLYGIILTEIGAIHREEREEVLQIAATTMISRNIDCCYTRAVIIKMISSLPPTDRTDEAIDAIVQINLPHDGSLKSTQLMHLVDELLQDTDGKKNFAKTLIALVPYFENCSGIYRVYHDGFLKILKEERTEVISLLSSRFKTVTSPQERISVLSIISLLPNEIRLSALRNKESIDALFAMAANRQDAFSFDPCPIAQKIEQIPSEERMDFIKLAGRFMKCYKSPTLAGRWLILLKLTKIPLAELGPVIDKVGKIVTEKVDGRIISRYIEIFHTLGVNTLNVSFRESLTRTLLTICDETEEGCDKNINNHICPGGIQLLLTILKRVPPKSRVEVHECLRYNLSETLALAKLLPPTTTDLAIFNSISLIATKMPDPQKGNLIEKLKSVPQEHYLEVLSAITANLDVVNNKSLFLILAEMMNLLPSTDIRKGTIETIISLHSGLSNETIKRIRFNCIHLDAVDRAPALQLLLSRKQTGSMPLTNILLFFYSEGEGHEGRKMRSRQHLFNILNSIDDSPSLINLIAKSISINPSQFSITDELDPLYQRAIEVATITDPSGASNPKNPYRIYRELKTLGNTITTYTPPTEIVCGESVRFNPIASQEFAKRCALNPRFKDLPSDVQANSIELLFKGIEDHAKTLEGEAKQKYCDSLHMGLEYQDLKDVFLVGELRVKLGITGTPEQIVSLDVALFFAIVHSILKKSNERPSPEQLSPCEETLLMNAAFFKSCKGGKQEATVRTYYTHLSEEDRIYKLKEEQSPGLYVAENLIHQEIQKILVPLFSEENAFTREITGTALENQVIQLPHQAIYAKNIIGMRMGLEHSLTFDQSTDSLADHLLSQDIPSLLTSGYRYFLPSMAVKAIQAAVTKKYIELQAKDTLNKAAWEQDTSAEKSKKPPESLARLFYTQMNELADKIDRNHDIPLWELDEETGEISACAPEGALAFLKGSGQLESLKRSRSTEDEEAIVSTQSPQKKQRLSDQYDE